MQKELSPIILSFILHELMFSGYRSQIDLYLYTHLLHSCTIVKFRNHVAATVQMYSDPVFFSTDVSQMKTVINN